MTRIFTSSTPGTLRERRRGDSTRDTGTAPQSRGSTSKDRTVSSSLAAATAATFSSGTRRATSGLDDEVKLWMSVQNYGDDVEAWREKEAIMKSVQR